ncbi:bromodomain-containing protein [Rhizophagus irregularis DAOM 181602=DAOM 197198]|nr:bromodomain-containing protein [Rhizophagus irregularis DAOM 181602=DAOM 197198]
MSISESYPGQNVLISYIKKQKTKISYCGFLKNYHDIIVISTFTDNWNKLNSTWTVLDNWNNLDNLWAGRFLSEGKDLPNLKDKLNIERSRYARTSQIYWKRIIEEYKKEKDNHLKKIIEVSAKDQSIPANHSIPVIKNHSSNSTKDSIFIKNYSISISAEDHSIPTNEHSISARNHSKISFKNTNLNNFCNDILQKLDEQSNIHPFYNYDEDSNKIIKNQMDLFTINSKLENNQYTSTKEFENDIRLIFRNCYTYNDMGSEIYCLGEELESAFNRIWTEKIIFHIKQKEKLKRARDTNDADSSSDESVLQAIVESLLPLKYRIPELLLVMDGTKLKGFGHFGYSDIFVLKGIGDNNVKYGETRQTTIGEVLENGVNQLKSYMNVISNGKTINYSSSGIFDERVKITKSNPNKLKGFVILVVGFHRVLWRSVEEIISDYSYDKI